MLERKQVFYRLVIFGHIWFSDTMPIKVYANETENHYFCVAEDQ